MRRAAGWLSVVGVVGLAGWAAADYPCRPGPVYGPPVVVVPVYEVPRVVVTPPSPVRTPPPAKPTAGPTIELARPTPAPSSNDPGAAVPAPPKSPVAPAAAAVPAPIPGVDTPGSPKEPDRLPPLDVPLVPPPARPAPASPFDPKKADELPPLVLPPDGPGGPSGVVPPAGGVSRSRSSPLGAGPGAEVVTVAGDPPAGPTRKVGFFNHTDAAVELVIEGKRVTLPKRSFLHAAVKPTFTWKYNGGEAETATVPADAAGVDVVFRE